MDRRTMTFDHCPIVYSQQSFLILRYRCAYSPSALRLPPFKETPMNSLASWENVGPLGRNRCF
jgi:hypothetical protein